MIRFHFSTEAEQDFRESFDWYERQKSGLGEKFESAVYSCLEKIAANPQHFGKNAAGYRKMVVPVFPYIIVYELDKEAEAIFVVAIAHSSRDISSR